MLELYALKGACTVLRGRGWREPLLLPDRQMRELPSLSIGNTFQGRKSMNRLAVSLVAVLGLCVPAVLTSAQEGKKLSDDETPIMRN